VLTTSLWVVGVAAGTLVAGHNLRITAFMYYISILLFLLFTVAHFTQRLAFNRNFHLRPLWSTENRAWIILCSSLCTLMLHSRLLPGFPALLVLRPSWCITSSVLFI
jgi:hypothetical protein